MKNWASQSVQAEDTPETQSDSVATSPSPAGTGKPTAGDNGGGPVAVETQTPAAVHIPRIDRPRAIWNRLSALLDQQLVHASHVAGPLGLEFHREAVYVMTALSDEIFVHLNWEGREFWLGHLLEDRFFQTHFAGEQFFRRLDALLNRDDEQAAELAGVYLTALALGFRGRYWGLQHTEVLDQYRKRLFYSMTRRDPGLAEAREQMFPQAYRNVIRDGLVQGVPEPRRWLWVLAVVVGAWLLTTCFLWYNLSSGLRHQLCCLSPTCSENCSGK